MSADDDDFHAAIEWLKNAKLMCEQFELIENDDGNKHSRDCVII
jgi:hypothetical protein